MSRNFTRIPASPRKDPQLPPIDAVTRNPERDSIIKTHSGYIDKQPLVA
jgi:hypothetical protein